VWFGEYLPQDEFLESEKASSNADIFIVVGTSGIVYPAASMIHLAKERGAYIIEINLEKTEISSVVDQSFWGKAGEILPTIYDELRNIKTNT
jgi:NAD-dependent deacetylase